MFHLAKRYEPLMVTRFPFNVSLVWLGKEVEVEPESKKSPMSQFENPL